MEKHIKAKIDKLVDVFLDQLLSTDSDAGWHNSGQYMSTDADAIKSTAGDKDMRMIMECRFIRGKHELYPMAVTMLNYMKQDYRLALLYHRYMEGRIDPETEKVMTESGIAAQIEISPDQYRHCKKMAYKRAETIILMLMDYDHSKKAAKREVA